MARFVFVVGLMGLLLGGCGGSDFTNPSNIAGNWTFQVMSSDCPFLAGLLSAVDGFPNESFAVNQTGSSVNAAFADQGGNLCSLEGTYDGREFRGVITVEDPDSERTIVVEAIGSAQEIKGRRNVDGTLFVLADSQQVCDGAKVGFWVTIQGEGGVEPIRQILIRGCVDDGDDIVSGADVSVYEEDISTVSATDGTFTLNASSLPGGSYLLFASKGDASGMASVTIPSGNITRTITLDGCISIDTGESQQQVIGKVVAPDETTPIAGATAYIPGDGASVPPVGCAAPDEPFLVAACTDAQGDFSLTLPDGFLPTDVTVKVLKGSFDAEKTVPRVAPTTDMGTIILETGTVEIAVVTGYYDRMEDILAKLGFGDIDEEGFLILGTETFDLYSGNVESLPGSYPDASDLFFDIDEDGMPDIYNYDIVFINCGSETGYEEESVFNENAMVILREYVNSGGNLYVTDLAYDYIEQAFPEYIDFFGSDGTAESSAETVDEAQVGDPYITTDADVLDPLMAQWLDGVTCVAGACRNTDGTVHIAGFLPGWTMINGAHPGQSSSVTIWAQGPVTGGSGQVEGVRPLTISFTHGAGKVIYSSYHTEEETPTTGFHPQERILQYLVFEL